MAGKSPEAFRTISEVADWLDRPAHVLRFWESKFNQIKPVKRAGGRRYYRPEDMLLLGGIKKLLHDDGMTIKGAQKVLRDQGVRYVSALSQPLDEDTAALAGDVLDDVARVVRPEQARDLPPAMPEPFEPETDSDADVMLHQDADHEDDDPYADTEDEPAPELMDAAEDPAPEAMDTAKETDVAEEPAPPTLVASQEAFAANSPDAPAPPAALGADLPPPPDLDAIQPEPGVLSAIAARRHPLRAADRAALMPVLAQLDDLVTRLSAARKG